MYVMKISYLLDELYSVWKYYSNIIFENIKYCTVPKVAGNIVIPAYNTSWLWLGKSFLENLVLTGQGYQFPQQNTNIIVIEQYITNYKLFVTQTTVLINDFHWYVLCHACWQHLHSNF